MKNAFYFTLKALFFPEIFKFSFRVFGHVGKRLDTKGKKDFRTYDAAKWLTNNYNTQFARYLKN